MRCVQLFKAASNWSSQHSVVCIGKTAYQRDDFAGVLCEILRKFVVVYDEVGNVDIAVVLLYKDILSNLISVLLLGTARDESRPHVPVYEDVV